MRKFAPVMALGSFLSILSLQSFTFSEAPILAYIDQYKPIAISEMQRTGIPASITLAQAIVESKYGTSTLSKKSNNHFGIKCKGGWQGKTFYFKDDDFKNGKLIKSCFRGYEDSVESYYDHSDFLVENPRYQQLFELSRTDYKGWAKGLKKCGYATAKDYASALINMIERYDLYQLDEDPTYAVPEEIVLIAPVQRTTEVIAYKPVATYQAATSAPKAFELPNNYQRGAGKRSSSVTNNRSFKEDVFQGEGPYLFEIVPNVERE